MIDSYIIINRKPSLIIKLFIYNILFLTLLVIWCINTFYYHSFFQVHSQILRINSLYCLEVLIPVEGVNIITSKSKIEIASKIYNYQVYKIDPNAFYDGNKNYQKLYLKIDDLEDFYKINGYQMEVKIEKTSKKIIDYFKNQLSMNKKELMT